MVSNNKEYRIDKLAEPSRNRKRVKKCNKVLKQKINHKGLLEATDPNAQD
jgi:hypothetical protein